MNVLIGLNRESVLRQKAVDLFDGKKVAPGENRLELTYSFIKDLKIFKNLVPSCRT